MLRDLLNANDVMSFSTRNLVSTEGGNTIRVLRYKEADVSSIAALSFDFRRRKPRCPLFADYRSDRAQYGSSLNWRSPFLNNPSGLSTN
jgi:hypothetical protein